MLLLVYIGILLFSYHKSQLVVLARGDKLLVRCVGDNEGQWKFYRFDYEIAGTCLQKRVLSDMFAEAYPQGNFLRNMIAGTCLQKRILKDMFARTCSQERHECLQRHVPRDMFSRT